MTHSDINDFLHEVIGYVDEDAYLADIADAATTPIPETLEFVIVPDYTAADVPALESAMARWGAIADDHAGTTFDLFAEVFGTECGLCPPYTAAVITTDGVEVPGYVTDPDAAALDDHAA